MEMLIVCVNAKYADWMLIVCLIEIIDYVLVG